MNEKIKTASLVAISASAVVASSVYVYSNVVKDNRVPAKDEAPVTSTTPTPSSTSLKYKDGAYTAAGDYDTAGPTRHKMEVVITLKDDVITAATTELKDEKPSANSIKNNDNFEEALKTTVVGKRLDEVKSLGVITGASDTTRGFNDAVEIVKNQAKL